MFKFVPFNPAWAGNTGLDMHAMYKRRNGDLMALPLRRHHQWEAKGYAYVTLATAEDLSKAWNFIRSTGMNPQDCVAGIDGDGRQTPWNTEAYLASQQANQADADADLKAQIAEFGVEAVEKIRGQKVPAHLKADAKKTTKAGAAA